MLKSILKYKLPNYFYFLIYYSAIKQIHCYKNTLYINFSELEDVKDI